MVESVRNERNILAMANNPFVVSFFCIHRVDCDADASVTYDGKTGRPPLLEAHKAQCTLAEWLTHLQHTSLASCASHLCMRRACTSSV